MTQYQNLSKYLLFCSNLKLNSYKYMNFLPNYIYFRIKLTSKNLVVLIIIEFIQINPTILLLIC